MDEKKILATLDRYVSGSDRPIRAALMGHGEVVFSVDLPEVGGGFRSYTQHGRRVLGRHEAMYPHVAQLVKQAFPEGIRAVKKVLRSAVENKEAFRDERGIVRLTESKAPSESDASLSSGEVSPQITTPRRPMLS